MRRICNLCYRGWTDTSQSHRPAGRLLVLLTSLLILVMPLTEHLCNWDRFLRGGSDVEFNLLAGLLFAALVILAMDRSMTQPLVAMIARTLTRWVGVPGLLLLARWWPPERPAACPAAQRGARLLRNHGRSCFSYSELPTPLRI